MMEAAENRTASYLSVAKTRIEWKINKIHFLDNVVK